MRKFLVATAAATLIGTGATAGGLLDAQQTVAPTPPTVVPSTPQRGSLGPLAIGGLALLLIAGGLADSGGGS